MKKIGGHKSHGTVPLKLAGNVYNGKMEIYFPVLFLQQFEQDIHV